MTHTHTRTRCRHWFLRMARALLDRCCLAKHGSPTEVRAYLQSRTTQGRCQRDRQLSCGAGTDSAIVVLAKHPSPCSHSQHPTWRCEKGEHACGATSLVSVSLLVPAPAGWPYAWRQRDSTYVALCFVQSNTQPNDCMPPTMPPCHRATIPLCRVAYRVPLPPLLLLLLLPALATATASSSS